MGQRLLKPDEIDGYKSQIAVYHPSGEVVLDFARSNFAVIAGPTGAGKDTIRDELLKEPGFAKVLSTTSRPPRPGESENSAYHFRDLKFFDEGMEERRFLQVALVHNQQLSCLDFSDISALPKDQIGLSIIIVQTEKDLRRLNPDLRTVFVVPPSLNVLIERMNSGRKIDNDEMSRRLSAGREELLIALSQPYYFCVVNDDLTKTVQSVRNYLIDNNFDTNENERARQAIKNILEEFNNL